MDLFSQPVSNRVNQLKIKQSLKALNGQKILLQIVLDWAVVSSMKEESVHRVINFPLLPMVFMAKEQITNLTSMPFLNGISWMK